MENSHHHESHLNNDQNSNLNQQTMCEKLFAFFSNYSPLITIIVFCLLIPTAQIDPYDYSKYMDYFMGYFFIFLSMFKFFNLKGFVDGFATYDLITQKIRAYGYLYPFIELGLGLSYLSEHNLLITYVLTVLIMAISGAGVIKSILSGQKLKCACLGTSLNVPLSMVSVIENVGMGAMAAYQLLI